MAITKVRFDYWLALQRFIYWLRVLINSNNALFFQCIEVFQWNIYSKHRFRLLRFIMANFVFKRWNKTVQVYKSHPSKGKMKTWRLISKLFFLEILAQAILTLTATRNLSKSHFWPWCRQTSSQWRAVFFKGCRGLAFLSTKNYDSFLQAVQKLFPGGTLTLKFHPHTIQ